MSCACGDDEQLVKRMEAGGTGNVQSSGGGGVGRRSAFHSLPYFVGPDDRVYLCQAYTADDQEFGVSRQHHRAGCRTGVCEHLIEGYSGERAWVQMTGDGRQDVAHGGFDCVRALQVLQEPVGRDSAVAEFVVRVDRDQTSVVCAARPMSLSRGGFV